MKDLEKLECRYKGHNPERNTMCDNCPLYLNTCVPVANSIGYALGSECDCYLCSGCIERCEIGDQQNFEDEGK